MKVNDFSKVKVYLRHDANNVERLLNSCGNNQIKQICQKVIKGKGKALISIEELHRAIISIEGYSFMVANFLLYGLDTGNLLRSYLEMQVKTNPNHKVLVKSKKPETLEMLANEPEHTGCCGIVGKMMAQMVLEGNGSAIVDSRLITTVIDADLPYTIIIDNFEIVDLETDKPLLISLIEQYINNRRQAC